MKNKKRKIAMTVMSPITHFRNFLAFPVEMIRTTYSRILFKIKGK